MGLRLLVLLALVSVADAHAYRRPPPPPPPPQQITVRYVRTNGGVLDRVDRANIVRFLTGSMWDGPKGRIRFVDPTGGSFSRPPDRVHTVMIREIERTRAGILIGVDGMMLTLTTCRVGRGVAACLEGGRGGGGFGGDTYGGL